ncbi:hypothetical protein BRCON_0892 [Candidatus Sumerlaea chitinivorans]|uniref:Zinc-finger domain-containing protein n=1 Tax=Sumerlaea chitinivorans TaxID=2250252 RepID=A0A2Z4Y3V9_SUMC1|nr:hypothetical protein BRCON_0892 [Candidatus Sumerlaea chitinivorans]
MRCAEVRLNLQEYRHGRLDSVMAEAIRKHLEHCIRCRRLYLEELSLAELLKKASEVPLPPTKYFEDVFVAARVRATLSSPREYESSARDNRLPNQTRPHSLLRQVLPLAASFIAGVVLTLFLTQLDPLLYHVQRGHPSTKAVIAHSPALQTGSSKGEDIGQATHVGESISGSPEGAVAPAAPTLASDSPKLAASAEPTRLSQPGREASSLRRLSKSPEPSGTSPDQVSSQHRLKGIATFPERLESFDSKMPERPDANVLPGSAAAPSLMPATKQSLSRRIEASALGGTGSKDQNEGTSQLMENKLQSEEASVGSSNDLADYLAAGDLVLAGKYEDAYRKFREIGERLPPTAFRVRALLRAGEIASQYLRDPNRAREVLTRCLQPEYAALIDETLRESIQRSFQALE